MSEDLDVKILVVTILKIIVVFYYSFQFKITVVFEQNKF